MKWLQLLRSDQEYMEPKQNKKFYKKLLAEENF